LQIRRRAVRSVLASGAALAAVATTVALAPTASAAKQLNYVALGDSYSAASGLFPADPTANPLCLRSTLGYPKIIAAATGANFTDVTCGAATTDHMTTSQYLGVPAQFAALRSDTDLVTLTIGGNDNMTFLKAAAACGTAGMATLGFGSPCKNLYGSTFVDEIRTKTYPGIVNVLNGIKARSPKAKVAILDYPQILPRDNVGCYAKVPIARGDISYVNGIQDELNSAVARAAAATGVTLVKINAASQGHDVCKPAGVKWNEPVLFGTNVLHPNALGEQKMAEITRATLGL
jgi:lysophospholipase L1-like esterase